MGTFVLDLLILCLQVKNWLIIHIYFLHKKTMIQFCLISKMNERNSIKSIDKTILSEQTKLQLSKIIGTENYFFQDINQRKSCSEKLNKYVTAFDYIDKVLVVLSTTSTGVSIISFTSTVGEPVGTASASFTLIFYLTTGIVNKLLNITRNKKKKHEKFLF